MSAPSWDLSSEAELVQVQAVLARLDVGAGHARIRIYTTAQPADGKKPIGVSSRLPTPADGTLLHRADRGRATVKPSIHTG